MQSPREMRLMKLGLVTYAWLALACGPRSQPPVDTARTLPPADPAADVSRPKSAPGEPAKSSEEGEGAP